MHKILIFLYQLNNLLCLMTVCRVVMFKDHIKDLPDKFNVFERSDIAYKKEVAIRHYAGIYKPWLSSADKADVDFYKHYYCDFL